MTLEQENKLKRLNYRPEEACALLYELNVLTGGLMGEARLHAALDALGENEIDWLRMFAANRRAQRAMSDLAEAFRIPCERFLTRLQEIFRGMKP